MGLSDLKKNATPSRESAKPLSLDEFIEAATLYAMGETRRPHTGTAVTTVELVEGEPLTLSLDTSNVVNLHRPQTGAIQLDSDIEEERPHYRKATFSLSEAVIAHLAILSEEGDISKSKLIRLLIEQHFALPTALRQMREQQAKKA